MSNKQVRIILDTNLWISFLITNNYQKFESLLFSGKVILIFSEELLEEFIGVAKRPKLKKYFSNKDVENILDTIDDYAEFIDVTSQIDICRDKKDNFLLSLAEDSKAEYLISGDNDLLDLKTFSSAKIVSIADFYQLVKI